MRHTAVLAAVPRPWFEEILGALLDAVEGVGFDGGRLAVGSMRLEQIRLVAGDHLAPGARYRVEFEVDRLGPDIEPQKAAALLDVTIASWDRVGDTRIDAAGSVDGDAVDAELELRAKNGRPETVHVTGTYRGTGRLSRLRRASWKVDARLAEWWAQGEEQGPRRGNAPVSVGLTHPLARAGLRLTCGEADGGGWKTEATVSVRGRWLLRPLVAIALLVGRRPARRRLREALDVAVRAWNAAVPDVIGREVRERFTFHHRVTVEPVPREWFERYVAALHDTVERLHSTDTTGEGGAAVAGPTAPTADMTVVSWDRSNRTRVEVAELLGAQAVSVDLHSAQRPTTLQVAGTSQEPGSWSALTRTAWELRADLGHWWARVTGAARSEPNPPVLVVVSHPLGEAWVEVRGAPMADGRWPVDVAVTVEGQAWARPLVAVAGTVGGRWLQDFFREEIDEAAEGWNRTIRAAVDMDPHQAAAATLSWLRTGPQRPERSAKSSADGLGGAAVSKRQ